MAGLQALANVAATARVAYEMIQNSATGCVLRFGSFDQAQRVLGFALQPILAGHKVRVRFCFNPERTIYCREHVNMI